LRLCVKFLLFFLFRFASLRLCVKFLPFSVALSLRVSVIGFLPFFLSAQRLCAFALNLLALFVVKKNFASTGYPRYNRRIVSRITQLKGSPMRIAIISDSHGNAFALETALVDIKSAGVDTIVCLGDAIQGGPQPAQIVAIYRDLNCPIVIGNADAWMLTGVETGHEAISPERLVKMNAVREWSLSQLTDDDRAFINTFTPTVEIPLEGAPVPKLLCFHGSPASFDDIILPTTPDEEFQGYLAAHRPAIMTGGHTHMQQTRRIDERDSFFFNPGAIGLAYSHAQTGSALHTDAWTEYALLTLDRGRVLLEFRRIPYDVNKLVEIYRASGRPHAEDMIAGYLS
jgi:predicted phosphodiesterase